MAARGRHALSAHRMEADGIGGAYNIYMPMCTPARGACGIVCGGRGVRDMGILPDMGDMGDIEQLSGI